MLLRFLVLTAAAAASPAAIAQNTVHVVYMGGNDCPPCVVWRQTELPKLQQTAVFKTIKFSYVTKAVRSVVPPAFFLTAEVKPLKEKLDIASGGNSGSPQVALIVNGEVFDYSFGAPAAETFEKRLLAAQQGGQEEWKRCLQRGNRWACVKPG